MKFLLSDKIQAANLKNGVNIKLKINFKKTDQYTKVPFAWAGSLIEIIAELEDDDSTTAVSTNSGNSDIKLTSNSVRFALPLHTQRPHPDLIALISLKLFSPYIGSRLQLQENVSKEFAEVAIASYPNLKEINFHADTKPRNVNSQRAAVSFSGGADSVAAAAVLPPTTPLIQLARMDHPMLPGFEKWYKTIANIKTLEAMPNSFPKYTVFSDMEFLSTNGRWCVYPDTYAFTLPTMLLADTLQLDHVITGDIWVAFTGDETIFNSTLTYKRRHLFEAAGLSIEYPCNGVGEISSLKIADKLIGHPSVTTCQYGEFQKPCMKCIKCFRKSLIMDAIKGTQIVLDNLERFNNSPAVIQFSNSEGRKSAQFAPSYKWCSNKISYLQDLQGPAQKILERSRRLDLDASFCDAMLDDVYVSERPKFIAYAKENLRKTVRIMNMAERDEFSKLDWKNNNILP